MTKKLDYVCCDDATEVYDQNPCLETTRQLVYRAGNPNVYSPGFTLLARSALRSDFKSVDYLLAKGANPNLQTPDCSVQPLLAACGTKGDIRIVAALLAAGAKVSASDVQGDTAVLRATQMGKVEIVDLLLQHQADPTLQNVAGRSALNAKVDSRHAEQLCRVFSKYGYRPSFDTKTDPLTERFREIQNRSM